MLVGLLTVLLVTPVNGAFASSSTQADTVSNTLYCTPSVRSAQSGEWITFTAAYTNPTFYVGDFSWTAAGGTPSYGTGSAFGTRFYTGSSSETRTVTVSDGYQTATCTVYVYNPAPTPYPTPTPNPYPYLQCSPSYTTANSGDLVYMNAWGGNGDYSWNAADGTPTYGYGSGFSTRFYNYQSYAQNRTVTVNSAGQSAVCTVLVNGSYGTPTPTPYPNGRIELRTLGRNVTRGQSGENTSVRARTGDTLDFIIRIRSTNGSYLYNAYVTDILPAGLTYISGSTTLNGNVVGDGVTSSGINAGTLSPNSETVIKFSARADGWNIPTWGTIVVNNTAQVRANGLDTLSVLFPITMGQNLNITNVSSVKTGPADAVWLALLVSALVTAAYAAYTRTDMFGRRTALAEVNRLSRSTGLDFSK